MPEAGKEKRKRFTSPIFGPDLPRRRPAVGAYQTPSCAQRAEVDIFENQMENK
jgi:hypothetical protein